MTDEERETLLVEFDRQLREEKEAAEKSSASSESTIKAKNKRKEA